MDIQNSLQSGIHQWYTYSKTPVPSFHTKWIKIDEELVVLGQTSVLNKLSIAKALKAQTINLHFDLHSFLN